MENNKIFYANFENFNKWVWIGQIPITIVFLSFALKDMFFRHTYMSFYIVFSLFYLLSLAFLRICEIKKYFRRYVQTSGENLKIKSSIFGKTKIINWHEIDLINLELFEPVLYTKNHKPKRIIMQYEQTKILRDHLKQISKEKEIRIEEKNSQFLA